MRDGKEVTLREIRQKWERVLHQKVRRIGRAQAFPGRLTVFARV
jgi:hypothetical protein